MSGFLRDDLQSAAFRFQSRFIVIAACIQLRISSRSINVLEHVVEHKPRCSHNHQERETCDDEKDAREKHDGHRLPKSVGINRRETPNVLTIGEVYRSSAEKSSSLLIGPLTKKLRQTDFSQEFRLSSIPAADLAAARRSCRRRSAAFDRGCVRLRR